MLSYIQRIILIAVSVLLFGGTDLFALSERQFNYADEALLEWGTGLSERYDVAIRLPGKMLSGCSITNISIPLNGISDLGEIAIWGSNELKLDGKVNSPDIFSSDAIIENNEAFIKLDEPLKIPEEGVFIGCSFTVNSLTSSTKAPLSVSRGGNENTFLIHSSRKYTKWGNYDLDLALNMSLELVGDFSAKSLEVTSCHEGNVVAGESWQPEISIRNIGLDNCQKFNYTLYVNKIEAAAATKVLNSPLKPDFARETRVILDPILAPEAGHFDWEIKITSVDGLENSNLQDYSSGNLYVWLWGASRIPLVEEFTGTWCGWCPRGAVGLKKMSEKYGDDFIAIVYHTDGSKDPMATPSYPPVKYDGAPQAVIDRCRLIDPFYGLQDFCLNYEEGIDLVWRGFREEVSPAEINVEAYWTDIEKKEIEIEGNAMFARDYQDRDIRIAYFLIADGLSSSSADWAQSNYYSGMEKYNGGDLKVLYESPKYIFNEKYDKVLIYSPDVMGSEDSLPNDLMAGRKYKFQASLPVSEAKNIEGESLVQDKSMLEIVVAVVDADSNKILNCLTSDIKDFSGLSDELTEDVAKTTRYYDFEGRRMKCIPRGGGIKEVILSDGSIKITKIYK